MKKIMSSILALSLTVTTFAACSSNTTPSSSGASSDVESSSTTVSPQELKKVKIGYGNHLGSSLWFIAEEMDLFKDYGLDVELTAFASSADQLAAIQSGDIFGGTVGGTASFASIAQGADLSLWGGQMHEGSGIITLPENAELYSDFANYKGKKFGLVRMSTGDVVFRYGIMKAGLTVGYEGDGADVTIVELDSVGSVTEAVKKGEVDMGASWIPNLKNAEAQGLTIAMLSGEVIANHPCAAMIAANTSLEANAATYKDIQKALIKAFDVYVNQPDKAIPLIQNYLELDTEVIRADAYSRFSPNPEINETAAQTFWNAMIELKYIESNVDITKHLKTSFFTDALNELMSEEPSNSFYKELAKGGYGSNA